MNNAALAQDDTIASAKRQQILEGARRCFLAQGFDGASINDIVKAAGVSKGTVYAYFASKEKLFEALVYQDRRRQAEQAVVINDDGRPMRDVLIELGLRMAQRMTTDEAIAQVRMVAAAAGKFPEIGSSFFEAGPGFAIGRIADYFKTKMQAGQLQHADAELAAIHFIDLTSGPLLKPCLFGARHLLKPRSAEDVVAAGVDLFLRGYSLHD